VGGVKKLDIDGIPLTRTIKKGAGAGSELHKLFVNDAHQIRIAGSEWVKSVGRAKHREILDAGNPKYHTVEIDGTTGANSTSRKGFRPGSVDQAHNSVRYLYLGRQLADLANVLRPILLQTIVDTFPNSKTRTLAREWVWYVQRGAGEKGEGKMGKKTPSQRVGMRLPPDLGIYDVLWLVPEGREPASYAWFANYFAKKRFGYKYNMRVKKKAGKYTLRKKLRGFASESARRMRAKALPGVTIFAMFVKDALTGPAASSRPKPAKWGVPVIRVAFNQQMKTGVSP